MSQRYRLQRSQQMNNEQKKPATLDDVVVALEQNQETIDELLTWIKIENLDKVKNALEKTLDTPDKRIVYHLSDGNTVREIEKNCSVSDSQISRYQKKWQKLGLMKKVGAGGRGDKHIKVFNLEDFDIEVSKIGKKIEQFVANQKPESGEKHEQQ